MLPTTGNLSLRKQAIPLMKSNFYRSHIFMLTVSKSLIVFREENISMFLFKWSSLFNQITLNLFVKMGLGRNLSVNGVPGPGDHCTRFGEWQHCKKLSFLLICQSTFVCLAESLLNYFSISKSWDRAATKNFFTFFYIFY